MATEHVVMGGDVEATTPVRGVGSRFEGEKEKPMEGIIEADLGGGGAICCDCPGSGVGRC